MPIERVTLAEHKLTLNLLYGVVQIDQLIAFLSQPPPLLGDPRACRELADCRWLERAEGATTKKILAAARAELKARPFKAGRSALVVERPLFFGFARVYDAVAARGRDEALVTRSFDEALGWLGCAPSLERRLRDLLSDGAYQARLARRKAG